MLAKVAQQPFRTTLFNPCRNLRLLTTMANDSDFYMSFPDKPIFLHPWNGKTGVHFATGKKPTALARFAILYIVDRPSPCQSSGDAGIDTSRDKIYVRSCLVIQDLFRRLLEQEELSSSNTEIVLGARTFSSRATMRRQLYVLNIADDTLKTVDESVRLQAQKLECAVSVYEKDTKLSDSSILWRLRDYDANGTTTEGPVPDVLEESDRTPDAPSPIFQERYFSPVFHDYERAMKVLGMCLDCAEVRQLCDIAAQELSEPRSLSQLESMMKQPLVVVEGMDATGKTTLTQCLQERMKAARYSTPPPCLMPLRRFFDKLPEIVRRAYYSLGNYIVAQQIATECQTRAVVMDRYWHSTAAYGIANETSLEDLPLPGHHDYFWPTDLLKPTAVIFLTVTEEVRRERLQNRSDSGITFEERSLNRDRLFRKRLYKSYMRMQDPACMPVDASGSKEEVVEAVLKQLEQKGIHLA